MVLVIKAEWVNRIDIFLLPMRPLNDLLDRHVHRNHLAPGRANTCLVTHDHNWTGRPHDQHVVGLIISAFQANKINPTQVNGSKEFAFPIPHHLFHNVRCKDFYSTTNYDPDTFEGDFVARLTQVQKATNPIIKEVKHYEELEHTVRRMTGERAKLRGLLQKLNTQNKGVCIFLINHIHAAKKR